MNRIVVSKKPIRAITWHWEEELLWAKAEAPCCISGEPSCVVLGRNQNPYLECDMDYLKSEDIRLVRRKSGGRQYTRTWVA